jgi:hypothetical protein
MNVRARPGDAFHAGQAERMALETFDIESDAILGPKQALGETVKDLRATTASPVLRAEPKTVRAQANDLMRAKVI